MGGLFGGSQTVPQTQSTNQFANQYTNTAQTGAQSYAANPTAQQMGTNIYDLSHAIMRGDWGGAPLLNIAGLTPGQQTGISGLTDQGYAAGNALVPAGQQALISSGQAITPWDINQFYNPMAGNITANLQDIFNQQNLQDRIGSVAKTGGVGAERAAVSQALLGKQQGLAAGQTYAQLYQQALQAAQQQKAQQLQSGQAALQGGFGALGQGLQAAGIPQAQQQAVNQALYQQQLGAYQDPYMRLAALTGALPGIAGLGGTGASTQAGTAASQGTQAGTGAGQTTYPAPPFLSQVAGLGSLALGVGSLFAGSDKRMKTDIQKMGKDKESGLPMYAYRYKGDPKTYPKVVGPMAQDVKKKYPEAVRKFAYGGGIPRLQYGGPSDDSGGQQQQQDTNYYDDFTDTGGGRPGGGQATPYANEGATWDPKRIFSPDRLQKAQRAIAMAGKMAQQSQIARPRVAPITFPQVPWKSGITFARGGRLALNLPALSAAVMRRQQEGGRVDAATADSWGGHKVWRPGFPRLNPNPERQMERGSPFSLGRPTPEDILRLRNMRPEGRYQDGGEVDDDEAEPAGLPELDEDMVTGSPAGLPMQAGAGALPLPLPRPPGAGPGAPMTDLGGGGGGLPQVGAGGQSLFGKPVSPGAMALIQAGLGMLAASGQRDARGLPMSGLGAIGAGGMAGINTYQKSMEDQRKDLLARQGLAMRQQAIDNLERHRRVLEASGANERPIRLTDEFGKQYLVDKMGRKIIPPEEETSPEVEKGSALEKAAAFEPQTEEQKAAAVMAESGGSKITTPLTPRALEIIKRYGITPEQFDHSAVRYAKGDRELARGWGGGKLGAMMRQLMIARGSQYYIDMGMDEDQANATIAEFGAMKAGAKTLGQQEARITGALEKAASVAPVVKGLSAQIPRTQYPALNKIIMAAKEQTGDPTVVKYGIAIETLITEYGSALGQGSTVLTDHQQKRAESILQKAYSSGQMDAAVDQLLVEIDRVKAGVRKGMGTYLGKRGTAESTPFAPTPESTAVPKSQRDQALDWIKANPNDPRVPAMKKKLGIE